MSSMRVRRLLPQRSMISVLARISGSSVDSPISWVMPKIPFMGVRNSWLMLAKNLLFISVASNARLVKSWSSFVFGDAGFESLGVVSRLDEVLVDGVC